MEAREIRILRRGRDRQSLRGRMNAPGMNDQSRPSLLERLSALLMREPGDRSELTQLLRSAYSRNLLDADALSIIEGALTVSEMAVRDIMMPRAQVDFIDINEPVENVREAGDRHRALALPGDRPEPRRRHRGAARQGPSALLCRRRGVQRARDAAPGGIRAGGEAAQRAAARVPREPQPHGDRDRRVRRRRGPGDDRGRARADRRRHRGRVRLRRGLGQHPARAGRPPPREGAHADRRLQRRLRHALPGRGADTIGGFLIKHLGRLPKRGESVGIEGLRFQVLRADSRRVYTLLVDKPKT